MAAPDEAASRRIAASNENVDLPDATVAVLAVVASFLVGTSVYAAIQSGYTAIGLGFFAAVVLFVSAIAVFEAGRRLGAD